MSELPTREEFQLRLRRYTLGLVLLVLFSLVPLLVLTVVLAVVPSLLTLLPRALLQDPRFLIIGIGALQLAIFSLVAYKGARRAQEITGMVCPICNLGFFRIEIDHVWRTGKCPKCRARVLSGTTT